MRTQPLLLSHPALHPGRLQSVSMGRTAPVSERPVAPAKLTDSLDLSPEAQQLFQLTPEEEKQVSGPQHRDQQVRVPEQAPVAATGPQLRGGPTFDDPMELQAQQEHQSQSRRQLNALDDEMLQAYAPARITSRLAVYA